MAMGRYFTKAIVRCSSEEIRLTFGDVVLIKTITGGSPGNPAQGEGPTYTFSTTKSRAVVNTLAQTDIMNSGGIYQHGDITIELDEDLSEISDKTRGVGDRLICRGNEYRIVGKKKNQNINDRDHIFTYVMRKVD